MLFEATEWGRNVPLDLVWEAIEKTVGSWARLRAAVERVQESSPPPGPDLDGQWRAKVVALVRSTREHPDIRFGSSVRGAIDICRLAVELARMRQTRTDDWHVGLAAAKAALSGRIRLQDGCTQTPEQVVTGLYIGVFGQDPADDDRTDPGGKAMPGER